MKKSKPGVLIFWVSDEGALRGPDVIPRQSEAKNGIPFSFTIRRLGNWGKVDSKFVSVEEG